MFLHSVGYVYFSFRSYFSFNRNHFNNKTKSVPTTAEVKKDNQRTLLLNGVFIQKSYEKKILSKIITDNNASFEASVLSSYPYKYGNNIPYIPNKNTQTKTKIRLKF